jgi:endonuclease/exonuclease/phosphatase family metal-dependent hydrolase
MKISTKIFLIICVGFLFTSQSGFGQDTVKIMNYNLLNYGANASDTVVRHPYYRTVVQAANPDILVVEEILSQTAVNIFVSKVMNLTGNGTYESGVFINGYDSDNAVFFKSSKFVFISNTPIHTALRDINEFKLRHIASGDTIRFYAVHLKASSSSSDEQQRAAEVDSLRKVTNLLPNGSNFIVLGDYNIYKSEEQAYIKLKQVVSGNEGHVLDAINITGTWNNSAYAMYHTQSTRVRQFGGGATGGMDDRFDMILYSKGINDPGGITLIPGSIIAYGNDGNHYNDSINRPPNNAVPQNIANALHYAADHLPVIALLVFENIISVNNQSEVAAGFKLYQNYPNPFNPVTVINYEIQSAGGGSNYVSLDVFDVTGRHIENLFHGKQNAGNYEIEFSGEGLPSGVYIYRLTAGDYTEAKKMILIK